MKTPRKFSFVLPLSALFLLVAACGDIQVQPIGGSGNVNAGGSGACGDGSQTGAGGAGFGGGTVSVVTTGAGGAGFGGGSVAVVTTGAGGAGFGGNTGAGGASTDECVSDSDCPDPVGACVVAVCQGGICVSVDPPAGTPALDDLPGDCIDFVCSGAGILVVPDDSETPDDGNECTSESCSGGTAFVQNLSGTACTIGGGAGTCVNGACQAQGACNNGIVDGSETDIDCGGVCPPCAVGQSCAVGADCMSSLCAGGVCVGASCADAIKNGSETDVDCGGPVCAKCSQGKACVAGADCVSGVCTTGVCQ